MAIQLRWWQGTSVLEYVCSGRVDGEELIAANLEALADARFPGLSAQVCDMEQVTAFDIDREQILRIIAIDFRASARAPGMTRVGIACRDDLIFGYGRMYELLLDGRVPGWEVGVFRTRDEALAWLGVTEAP